MGRHVLVTGGAGFIGSHVVDQLVTEGCRVSVIDNRETGRWINRNELVGYYYGDGWRDLVEFPINTHSPVGSVTDIIHLAAWSNVRDSMTDPMKLYRNNVMGTAKVAKMALLAAEEGRPLRSVVFASSSAAEDMVSHYGVSKLAGEQMLAVLANQCPKTAVCALRLANVYGPRQNPNNGTVIANWVETLFTGEQPVMYGDGTMCRDYVNVESVADAFVTAMQERVSHSHIRRDGLTGRHAVYNVASGIGTTLRQLETYLSKAAKMKDQPLLPMLEEEARPGDVHKVDMELCEMLRHYGWTPPVHVKRGLGKLIDWRSKMLGTWEDNHLTTGEVDHTA